jgi:heme oxygenase (biliverdin-IX-beta and delta-forming)
MEGATLGGQLISRHLEQALGLKDGNGYAFFSSYGQEVGAMWRGFREMLIQQSSTSADDAIVRGATDTFHAMHAWLCRG